MTTTAGTIRVEVVAAWPDHVEIIKLVLPEGSLVRDALADPAVLAAIPAADSFATAIYSRLCGRDHPLREGDRIELCRPLLIDPKAARRERAEVAKIRPRKV